MRRVYRFATVGLGILRILAEPNAYASLFFVITATSMLSAAIVGTFSTFAAIRLYSNQNIPQRSMQLHFEIISLLSVLALGIVVITFITVHLTPIIF